MIVVIYLHDVMHPHVMLHVFTWQKMHVFTWHQQFFTEWSQWTFCQSIKGKQKIEIFSKKWHFHASAWHWLQCDHIDALTAFEWTARENFGFSRLWISLSIVTLHMLDKINYFCSSIQCQTSTTHGEANGFKKIRRSLYFAFIPRFYFTCQKNVQRHTPVVFLRSNRPQLHAFPCEASYFNQRTS